jgi:hypothetical protein
MKIGLSYSRCVRDIVDGKVDIADVLVLVTRTDFNPCDDGQWGQIWIGYGGGSDSAYTRGFFSQSNPEWAGYYDEAKFREISIDLYNSGRMHQPRQFGARPARLPHIWLETVLPSEELDQNPTLKSAWDKFQTLARLTGTELKNDHTA